MLSRTIFYWFVECWVKNSKMKFLKYFLIFFPLILTAYLFFIIIAIFFFYFIYLFFFVFSEKIRLDISSYESSQDMLKMLTIRMLLSTLRGNFACWVNISANNILKSFLARLKVSYCNCSPSVIVAFIIICLSACPQFL